MRTKTIIHPERFDPKNPFEILGLTPELVNELTEKQLKVVIKAMYRTLQKTFHPDMLNTGELLNADSPIDQKAVELNLAYESLNFDRDPTACRQLRKSYVSKRSTVVVQDLAKIKNQLASQKAKEDRLAANFFRYLTASVPSNGVPPKTILSAPLPAKNILLGLMDVAINNNLFQSSWTQVKNYKQIQFDSEGKMSVLHVGRQNFAATDFIRPLGCVPVSDVDLIPLLIPARAGQEFSNNAPFPKTKWSVKTSVLNLISLDNFKRFILPLLTPKLFERAYLFSLNQAEFKKSGHISLDGLIIRLEIKEPL
ncbi:MAG: J domain-containing protein [Deltaproteobacteria bacterium]|jgi:hypothetical protein|nr:J domain-containing protein [Deltaproteobacteria bacterium]